MTEPNKKIKILTLSDHPLAPTGVGIQTRLFAESLLKTGNYEIISLAGAHKHNDYTPMKTENYGDNWKIFPVDGYGSVEIIRSVVRTEKPDVLWMMTDPRYWSWLWQIEDEIRPLIPMVYYHVWDNYPVPKFNEKYYRSNDVVVAASKLTEDVLTSVVPDMNTLRISHTVDEDSFKILDESEVDKFRREHVGDDDKVIFFWNNRNTKRKHPTTLLWWFKEFVDEVGRENVSLLLHTDPKEPVGTDIEHNLKELGLDRGEVMISPLKYSEDKMAMLYNMCDCTINISDAEGFGLSTLESLFCGTPIIVTKTGGLQEQVTDGKNTFGVGIDPSSQTLLGSHIVPYIYEDHISKEDFLNAMRKIYNMTKEQRKELGMQGREYVRKNYSLEGYANQWNALIEKIHSDMGSWNTRTHKNWELIEVTNG